MSASVVRAYGVGRGGAMVVRCFRVHCSDCGYLTRVHDNAFTAERERKHHAGQCMRAPIAAAPR